MDTYEFEIIKSIKSFPLIKNSTSKKVKEQYEENPYPRWRNYYCNSKVDIYEKLSRDFCDQDIKNIKTKEPNILIAGCGTGFQVFLTSEIKNARIFAIDLSKRSLAYSIRKTNEAGIKNVTYFNMDILDLNMLNKNFDIIECVGVLHHMKEPLQGLKSLLNSLKTNGLLRLGIYSKIARKSVNYCRKFFGKKKVVSDLKGIRKCRSKIFRSIDNAYFNLLTKSVDFYSTSRVRDLLFHVQEHNFNLIEIEKILRDHNLRFVGFVNLSFEVYDSFKKIYKEESLKDLRKWHDFEQKNPSLFFSMYNFWVQKL